MCPDLCRTFALALALGLALATASPARAQVCTPPPSPSTPARPELLRLQASANAQRAAVEAGALEGIETQLDALAADPGVPPDFRPTLLVNLARTWALLAARDPARAERARRRAAEGFAEAAQAAAKAGDARVRSFALGYEGALYEEAGRGDDARALTRQALFEASRANAPDAAYRWYWQLGRLERAAGEREQALASLREAVRILDTLRAELASSAGGEVTAFRDEVEPVYLQFVDLLLRRAADAGAGDPATGQAALREARDALEALKAAELRDYYGDPCLAAQRQTAAEAIPGTVVLYPVVLADRVELIVGDDRGLTAYTAPVDGPVLVDTVHRFRQLLTKRTTREYLPLADQLYDWLIRPAAPSLEGRNVAALVVVPGGALRTIPFSALHDAGANLYLIEKLPVTTAPGLGLTNPQRIDVEHVQVLAGGISEAVQGFPALPNVRQEIADLDARFHGVSLVDAQFRAEAFELDVRARPFTIVHVASHGEFRADSAQSFVLAWDREISLDELARVVRGTRLRNEAPLELLTLSACQTAAGNDRAALGLAGIALRSGARSAVASLWSVSDEASARLMQRFYAELQGGASRAEALRRAQRELIETPAWKHPDYWAPFMLIGSWL